MLESWISPVQTPILQDFFGFEPLLHARSPWCHCLRTQKTYGLVTVSWVPVLTQCENLLRNLQRSIKHHKATSRNATQNRFVVGLCICRASVVHLSSVDSLGSLGSLGSRLLWKPWAPRLRRSSNENEARRHLETKRPKCIEMHRNATYIILHLLNAKFTPWGKHRQPFTWEGMTRTVL